MVGRILSLLILPVVLGSMFGAPRPAAAQCRLCETPVTTIQPDSEIPVKLEVETSLNFDRLIVSGGSGSAVLGPDGSHRTSGAVITMGGRAMVGTITVRGEAGRSVRVTLPGVINLYGTSGGEIHVDAVRTDLPSLARIGPNGTLSFRFGGELHVAANSDGEFRGDFRVDVDYL